jgi:hypothetical protein
VGTAAREGDEGERYYRGGKTEVGRQQRRVNRRGERVQ